MRAVSHLVRLRRTTVASSCAGQLTTTPQVALDLCSDTTPPADLKLATSGLLLALNTLDIEQYARSYLLKPAQETLLPGYLRQFVLGFVSSMVREERISRVAFGIESAPGWMKSGLEGQVRQADEADAKEEQLRQLRESSDYPRSRYCYPRSRSCHCFGGPRA